VTFQGVRPSLTVFYIRGGFAGGSLAVVQLECGRLISYINSLNFLEFTDEKKSHE
jgi:hypothetical protein